MGDSTAPGAEVFDRLKKDLYSVIEVLGTSLHYFCLSPHSIFCFNTWAFLQLWAYKEGGNGGYQS
jgi:hypothetical protein